MAGLAVAWFATVASATPPGSTATTATPTPAAPVTPPAPVTPTAAATATPTSAATPSGTGASGRPAPALFALIVGVNSSPEPEVAPLQYADDDAARYLDLFRALGARAYVLSRLDANTRRLHPQAAAEAVPPRRAELRHAVASLARDVEQARARGVPSTLYVVYAGHGNVDETEWSLTLEDDRLSGAQLMSEVVTGAGADQSHVIVDACHAYLLALPRGPGGTRRPLGGFVELEAAHRAGRVGFLLSSSQSGESHEWSGFEAGVFSHEVRSGLYGAADANGDGQVTYAEIGAFVSRANEAVTNERFRPRVLAQAPRGQELLLDLRGHTGHALTLDAADSAAHYLLENSEGVRVLDFHGGGKTTVRLLRPPGEGVLYLRRLPEGLERTVPRADGVVQMELLPVSAARTQPRGAAHYAFSHTFALRFDDDSVASWIRRSAEQQAGAEAAEIERGVALRNARLRRIAGIAAVGLAIGSAGIAAAFSLSAHGLHDGAPAHESQRETVARNEDIERRNRATLGFAVGAVAAGATAGLLLLWGRRARAEPEVEAEVEVEVGLSPGGGDVAARWRF